jgi:RNA polymerase sigma factor (sigma-70 family)
VTAPLLELCWAAHTDGDEGAAGPLRRIALRASDPPSAADTPFHPTLGAQLRGGDEAAFTAVIAATVPALIRYASARFRIGADAAEDVVQEMFARLWVNRANIPDRVTRGYLFRTVHNAVLNVVAHDRMAEAHAVRSVDATAVVVDTSDATEAALTLGRLLALLPDRRRQAIELRYWGHLSYAEVAEAMGTTPANAERLVARGLIQLQELAAELA